MKYFNHLILLFCASLISFSAFAQKNTNPAYTKAENRLKTFQKRAKLQEKSLVSQVEFRNAGPTVMSGRVVDLEVHPDDPTIFYVAYASGGLWKTEDNGISFFPLFDNEASMTIGDIAIDWKNKTIWVGTGENNSSRSSYAGTGVYKSQDEGKTWQYLGLAETQHTGRIILHPTNPNTVWVATLGHLYSKNEERGLYKTTDAGKTWKKTLFINDNTGIIDLTIDSQNPDILYAAAWERSRRAWKFEGSGKGTGIYKSTDGGENWSLITGSASGFPDTKGGGRIGIEVAPSNPQMIYAVLDNQDRRAKESKDEDKDKLTKDQLRGMSQSDFLKLSEDKINTFLDDKGFPQEYNAKTILTQVKEGKLKANDLVTYLEDANSLLFDTPVKGLECYLSEDGGKTWNKTHEKSIEDVVYSYGYYFGQVRVDAQNPNKIYSMGVPVIVSEDKGKTWNYINEPNVHVDHHALWINPKKSGHLILGNDGGIHISYDDGKNWQKANSPSVGQFYTVNVDMAKPYNIYGGLQDNGVWVGSSDYEYNRGWYQEGQYPYKRLLGGDGMQIAVDTRDNSTIYTGYQFGNYFRINQKTEKRKYITPQHKLGENPLRFNWQAPVHLSRHNQDILYMGSNKFHRSLNQGDDWETLSDDLTQGGKKGDVPYGTLSSIDESPLKFGLLYAGSDDGLVHVSKDGGSSWQKITSSLPENFWVSRVIASKYKEGRVYLALNGYRWDNFDALIYVSENYGQTWKKIGLDLPQEPVNVIKEDPENENLLYVGTDHGVYISLDRGQSFMLMNKDMPAVAVHDLIVHPRDKELVVATHGRSMFVADVADIQQLTPEFQAKKLHIFAIDEMTKSKSWGTRYAQWTELNLPKRTIGFYAKDADAKTMIRIKMGDLVLNEFETQASKGLNYFDYDLTFDESKKTYYQAGLNKIKKEGEKDIKLKEADNKKHYLEAGEYQVEIQQGSEVLTEKFVVKAPRAREKR
jgi:photosystem II stability/assembly factor-like uncharacterized protein